MLAPTPADDVDPYRIYADAHRAPVGSRPWVVVNMIASADGATTDEGGRSGGLGGPADREVFMALRSLADVIVAGGNTVRAENYGPPRTPAALEDARRRRGQAARPRIAVVSASLRLDPSMRLFAEPNVSKPIVITIGEADRDARRKLETVADVVVAGDRQLDWTTAFEQLRAAAGAGVVVVEGGPIVNGQLWAEDLVDELCLTVAPVLAGGVAPRIANGPPLAALRRLTLAHVLEADGFLLLRYVVDRER